MLRRILIWVALIGLGIALITNIGGIEKFWHALHQIHWYLIPLLIGIQLISYYCNARFYQQFFAGSHRHVEVRKLYELSLAINFANQVIPAGGVAGTTYLVQSLKAEVPGGTVTLAQLARYAFTFLSYFVILGFGFVLLFLSGDLNKVSVRIMLLVMLGVLAVGTIGLVILSERRRLERILAPILHLGDGIKHRVFRNTKPLVAPDRLSGFLDELYEGYDALTHQRRHRHLLFGWALGGNVAEVLTLYAVFVGFATFPNLGTVIAGYTLAIMASILGVFTGGVGVYEFGMIGTLSALGIPFALAFTVVIVYRGLSMLIFLPPGFFYYRKYLKLLDKSTAAPAPHQAQ